MGRAAVGADAVGDMGDDARGGGPVENSEQRQRAETSGVALGDGTWVFAAPWSPPWKALARQLRDELDAGVIGMVDIDARPEVADRWVIKVVPTVLVVRDGREVQRFVGALSPGRLRRLAGMA